MISVSNLTKRYSGVAEPSLQNMSLHVNCGDFFGLLGPNGCGKTTLISIMTGLLNPSSGKILVQNKNLRTEIKAIKPITGLIPQEIALYTSLSLLDNLKFFGRLYGLTGKTLKLRIEESLEISQLTQAAHRPIIDFSGGMQRRANLVVGLIHHPKVIYLDEPTVNVDPQSRKVIFKILKKLNQQGVTMVYTTHYLEEAEEMCNQIAVMNEGQVIAEGSPAELIASSESANDLDDVFMTLTGQHLRD